MSTKITSGHRFSQMSRGFRGFGGVVFGNDVSSTTPDIRSLAYVVDKNNVGTLEVTLIDDVKLMYGPVDMDLVQAAHRIVYTGTGKVEPLSAGNGVGLVGIVDNTPTYRCDAGNLKIEQPDQSFHVILNPALSDRQIGWSALMIDITPVKVESLIKRVRGTNREAADQLQRLFDSMVNEHFGGTWKVVDVPIEFGSDGSKMLAWRRAEPGNTFPEGLRRTAFLEMRAVSLDESKIAAEVAARGASADISALADAAAEYDREFAERFYRALPVLMRASYDYDHLNRFAAVLALVRLAKGQGAEFADPDTSEQPVPTPQAVVIDADGVRARAPFDPATINTESASTIRACREALERAPGFAETAERVERLSGSPAEQQEQFMLLAALDPQLGFYVQLGRLEERLGKPSTPFFREIPVEVKSGCGCTTGGDASQVGFLVLVLHIGRRRRSSPTG